MLLSESTKVCREALLLMPTTSCILHHINKKNDLYVKFNRKDYRYLYKFSYLCSFMFNTLQKTGTQTHFRKINFTFFLYV